jgi:hypothetical protein
MSLIADLVTMVGHYLSKVDRQMGQVTVERLGANRIFLGFSEISNPHSFKKLMSDQLLMDLRSMFSEKAEKTLDSQIHIQRTDRSTK